MDYEYKVGDRLIFDEGKFSYVVQAAGERYLICTRPFAAKKTVLYTIVDLQEKIRGTENLVFGLGFETQEECEAALRRLESRESEISHRNRVRLHMRRGLGVVARR